MTWPIVEGVSLMHLHVNRGKRSIVIDLRTEEGVALFLELVREADVVVEAMRPGGLARRGLSFERMREVNPKIVQCTISGYGATGPYRDLASHGIAYDAWAGIFAPETDANGNPGIPDHVSIGINAGPLFGALGILAAVIHARATGEGSELELAQSDAAAAFDWYRSETYRGLRAARSPRSPATSPTTTCAASPRSRACAAACATRCTSRPTATCSSWRASSTSGRSSCEALGRQELFEQWPGSQYGDHARGNLEMQAELTEIFATQDDRGVGATSASRSTCRSRRSTRRTRVHDDPQFLDRMELVPGRRRSARTSCRSRSRWRARSRWSRARRPRSASTPTRSCATSSATTTPSSPRSAKPAPSPDPPPLVLASTTAYAGRDAERGSERLRSVRAGIGKIRTESIPAATSDAAFTGGARRSSRRSRWRRR